MRRRIGVAMGLCASLLMTLPAFGEQDHLMGYKAKDDYGVQVPANPYTLTTANGTETCELKKVAFYLTQGEKNGGDDPRSGEAGDFVCYKAKCIAGVPPAPDVESQFGVHGLISTKAKLVCLPGDGLVCGDGELDAQYNEQCDGSDDAACPGACESDCTCPPQTCGNNSQEGTEECDGTDDGACPGDCAPDCTCLPPCEATTGGFCWFLSVGNSCNAICSSVGRVYDTATDTYAGGSGTNANCNNVLTALGAPGTTTLDAANGAFGCTYIRAAPFLNQRVRSTSPTTATANNGNVDRACACQ